MPVAVFPTNAHIAEWLAVHAEHHSGNRQKALKRASRKAFLWPREAAEILESGDSLENLEGVGPYLSEILQTWITSPPEVLRPHELRRDFLTLTEAASILASSGEESPSLKGDLQMHSTYSDGYGSINDLVDSALERGYEYIAITDHSKGLKIAGGIDEEVIALQRLDIDGINRFLAREGSSLRVLQSIELNLGIDGSADLENEVLDGLDLVLGSFHSKLRLEHDQTERYLAALEHPKLDILGHPRGRMYDFRLGLQADWPTVFNRAAELGKAVEIDAFPNRQDLNVELLELAREAQVSVSIGTDSHHPVQLGFMVFGLAAARKAGIPEHRILNFKSRNELLKWAALRGERR